MMPDALFVDKLSPGKRECNTELTKQRIRVMHDVLNAHFVHKLYCIMHMYYANKTACVFII